VTHSIAHAVHIFGLFVYSSSRTMVAFEKEKESGVLFSECVHSVLVSSGGSTSVLHKLTVLISLQIYLKIKGLSYNYKMNT
jgi:hypothetical protein